MVSLQVRFPPSRLFAPTCPTRLKSFKPLFTSPNSDLPLDGDDDPDMTDPVKLAFARAEAYKRQKLQAQSQKLEASLSGNGGSNAGLENPSSSANQGSRASQVSAPKGKPPEAEIIVGDPTKFENIRRRGEEPEKDDGETEAYRPKVKTWGVFPRPMNISKTYGGGKVIRPGDILETKEDKEAKEQRSRELVTAYKSKMGLDVDPKLIAECQKSLKDGNELMDRGRLNQALPFFEKVMKDMVFESELHGRAALQWSICLDSLQRSSEAKVMYKKLQNHPNPDVNTKARHFTFSFEAMEFMKVKSSYLSRTTGYEMYFDSFVDNKEAYTSAKTETKEAGETQILPYVVFLVSPLFVILLIAVRKSFML
ncbi:cytochrome C oxidase subunit [Rhynchospora pubera]|uniref:Cytochrome C oxidase subunit n=1 Tax=Rhynchospora pubera TaxID=906938 RepID=A0AAV8DTM6_9POAL|nr:cytochrome C oxidase subunit [Rhynchospora pubera]